MFQQHMTNGTIHFLPSDKICQVKSATSVLEVALQNGLDIPHSCGGMGSCTTCRILVERCAEALPARGELEQETADTRGFADHERLACQLPPLNGLVARIPDTLESDLA